MNTNYLGVIDFTELMLPLLLQQEESAIINISSIAALRSSRYLPTYAASKAALHSYTTSLRQSLEAYRGIRVFEVFPPLVNTAFSQAIGGEHGIPPEEVAAELLTALELDQLEVPIGETRNIFVPSM